MPIHRVQRADIEDAYKRIHRDGEIIHHVVVDGAEYVFFTTLRGIEVTGPGDASRRYAVGNEIRDSLA